MALDFLSHHHTDIEGSAFYVIHDGSHSKETQWNRFIEELQTKTKHQALAFSIRSSEGEKLRSFYGYTKEQLPIAIIVRDDDHIAYSWTNNSLPSSSEVSSLLGKESYMR